LIASQQQILSALNRLGIKHQKNITSKGWLGIICPNPSHNDKEFGNASINMSNGVVSCFSCGYKRHIVGVIQDQLHIDFKEACQYMENDCINYSSVITPAPQRRKVKVEKIQYDHMSVAFNPDNYHYTKSRGFTKEFCDTFNVHRIISRYNSEYFCIPIIDTYKGIHEYEFRKLEAYEIIQKRFGSDEAWKAFKKENELNYSEGKLYSGDIELYDEELVYLMRPKTLYKFDSRVDETLWNIDNLDYDDALFVFEGLGSIPKTWQYVSKNVTAVFGSNISQAQIDYMKRFYRVLYVPDFDQAGYKTVKQLNGLIPKLFIVDLEGIEDTDDIFVDKIKGTEVLTTSEYIMKYCKKFESQFKKGLF